ncbi:MAG: chemotaxis protein CheA [Rhodobacteraceae bacterium]|nr:chemotaxis protein CheA [Paracoccaceae bacterium]
MTGFPPLARMNPEEGYLGWQLRLPGTLPEQQLRDCFDFVEDVCALHISRMQHDTPAPSAPSPANASQADQPTIRVNVDRIDRLINLVGELVISQSMLEQTLGPLLSARHTPLRSAYDALVARTTDLQDAVMAIRAQPVKPLFQRMQRILREAAAASGKTADMICMGEMTEVDRSVIEGLTDPLTHMIRNAVDHGIEAPSARQAAGKPSQGTVTLSASHRAGRVVIELWDDGAGIDRARVRRIALDRGLIRPDQSLTEAEVDNLLFHPGFSTAKTVTSLSGRGVGLDVVRTALRRLGGRLTLQSQSGQGTRFSLSLPLTLAVADSMVLCRHGHTLLLPVAAVRETVRLQGADIRTLDQAGTMIRLRDRLISLCDAGDLLGLQGTDPVGPKAVAILVSDEEDQQIALIFDEVIDQRQVVIKGLKANCGEVPGISAATILGDGRVALILDPGDLVRRAAATIPRFEPESPAA